MKLKLSNVKRTFTNKETSKTVLDIKELEFEGNKLIGILGQSGAGKSTLLTILGCLDDEYQGTYQISYKDEITEIVDGKCNGKNIIDKIRIKYFSFVFQRYNLIGKLSVYENILLPLKYQHKLDLKKNIDEILERLNISGLKNQKVETLSGGEAQRVALARALVVEAPFILADEPTGALDYDNSVNLLKLFKEISRSYNRMIIMVTHNKSLLPYFDIVYEVKDGEVLLYEK